MKRVFISDCEGPISKNDNAFEATSHFIPNGDRLFALVSKYDDVLAGVLEKPGYNAGDTLKLILPFLKAFGVTDEDLKEFSAKHLVLIPGSKNTLEHLRSLAASFIVSTSYENYIRALCENLSFPFENTYCTRLSINNYLFPDPERLRLKELAGEIIQKPMIAIPSSANSLEDFSKQDRGIIARLDDIFWDEIGHMDAGTIFNEVKPIGGHEKVEAIKDAAQKTKMSLSDVMYVGDSITDVEAFKLVREDGGLTVSFNGNEYAVKNAEIAVLSENNTVTALIADLFCEFEKQAVLNVLKNWNSENLRNAPVDKSMLESFFALHPHKLPKVQIVTPQNMKTLIRQSSEFRRKIRGEAVGGLG